MLLTYVSGLRPFALELIFNVIVFADVVAVLAAVRIRAKMAKNLTDGRRTGGAAVGCGLSDRKFDCLLPTIGL